MSQREHRSSLFLLELILVIFFFSLASAVCIQLFVKAHLTEKETKELNRAVPLAESGAEAFHSVSGNLEELVDLFPEGRMSVDGNSFQIFYDADWQPSEEGIYALSITRKPSEETEISKETPTLIRATVGVIGKDGLIYEVDAAVQVPRTVPGS
ncbi:MAG: hypothetical protein HFI68_01465 [Lachnospiraceae bacterium]|nr:hypothetical protein [Lachnospiraceae bacterium]